MWGLATPFQQCYASKCMQAELIIISMYLLWKRLRVCNKHLRAMHDRTPDPPPVCMLTDFGTF